MSVRRESLSALLCGLLLCVCEGVLEAQPAARTALERFHDARRLSGDWGGWRSKWEEAGLRFDIFYNHFSGHKGYGGASPTPEWQNSGSLDLFARFDLDRANLRPGGEILVHVKSNWSRNINPAIGALSDPIDDADGNFSLYLYQIWYQRPWLDNKLVMRAGYIDQQSLFDRNAFANTEDLQFLNTYLDNNPVLPVLNGFGAALIYNPTDWMSIVSAVSDGEATIRKFNLNTAFNGDFNYRRYAEVDFRGRIPVGETALDGNYRFGFVDDPIDLPRIAAGGIATSNQRAYFSGDQMLYAEPNGVGQGLGVFARYGYQQGSVHRIEHFVSGGMQYAGLFPRRDLDTLGVAFYRAISSKRYRLFVDPTFDQETGYEFYYALQTSAATVLSPDLQYIDQPGGHLGAKGVWVFNLRLRLTL